MLPPVLINIKDMNSTSKLSRYTSSIHENESSEERDYKLIQSKNVEKQVENDR